MLLEPLLCVAEGYDLYNNYHHQRDTTMEATASDNNVESFLYKPPSHTLYKIYIILWGLYLCIKE